MPSKVKLNNVGTLIEAKSYGLVTKEDVSDVISKIKSISKKSSIRKILVDTTKQEKVPNVVDLIDLIETFPKELKIALVLKQTQQTMDDMLFVETAGLNRGLNIKHFTNKENALKWLNN